MQLMLQPLPLRHWLRLLLPCASYGCSSFCFCLLSLDAASDVPPGFMLWRCIGLSGRAVLWQLLHKESLDLFVVKYHFLSPSTVANLAAQALQQRQRLRLQLQEQQQQHQEQQGLLLLQQRVASALQHLQQFAAEPQQRTVIFATHAEMKGFHLLEVVPYLECRYTLFCSCVSCCCWSRCC